MWVVGAILAHGATFGGFSAWIASVKGRNSGNWFLLGFVFGIFALLAVGFAPAAATFEPVEELSVVEDDGPVRTCTSCGSVLASTSQICGNCGGDVNQFQRRAIRTRFGSSV